MVGFVIDEVDLERRPDPIDLLDHRGINGLQMVAVDVPVIAAARHPDQWINPPYHLAATEFLRDFFRTRFTLDHDALESINRFRTDTGQPIVTNFDLVLFLDFLVGEIGAKEIVTPVGGRDAPDFSQRWQIQPLVIVDLCIRIVIGEKRGVAYVGAAVPGPRMPYGSPCSVASGSCPA